MEEVKKSFEEQMYQKMLLLNRFHVQDKIDLLNALKENYGDNVLKIVEQVEGNKAYLEWQQIAQQHKDNSIEALIRLLWDHLRQKGSNIPLRFMEMRFRCDARSALFSKWQKK